MTQKIESGVFTGLSKNYSECRPDYSVSVLHSILGLIDKKNTDIDFVDVGAGTGIWTRMVEAEKLKSISAVEPNTDMRTQGIIDSKATSIKWYNGFAESTGLESECCDWISMASSFHWANFEESTKEFNRLLRPRGIFTALWNPRLIEVTPLLVEIEKHLTTLKPNIERISSGRSGITKTLTEQLFQSPYFDDVIYTEGRHTVKMTPQRYIGAWQSVNDLQAQLGQKAFTQFLNFVHSKVEHLSYVEATYLTRAWSARKVENIIR